MIKVLSYGLDEFNRANLKRLTEAELLAFKKSTFISYEFYVLVKEELKRRKPVVTEADNNRTKMWDAKKRKMVVGNEYF